MAQEEEQSGDFSGPEHEKQNTSDSIKHFKENYGGISIKAKKLAG